VGWTIMLSAALPASWLAEPLPKPGDPAKRSAQ
jgi:hypothetical protein